MYRSIFKVITSVLLFASGVLFADTGLPNPSARPQTSCSNLDVFGNALYWVASETADWAATITQSPQIEEVDYKTISFNWSPGFRVGLGYNLESDSWDTQACYTYFTTSSHDYARGTIHSAFFGQTISAVGYFQTASIGWKINYHMFDLDLGRSFLVSKDLSLRPSIGLKGGWIYQKIRSKWEKPELFFTLKATEDLNNNFTGIGPKFSVKGKWNFGNVGIHSFSLISEAASALLWGHWKINDVYQDNFLVTVNTIVKNRNFGATFLKAYLGGGWDFNFNKDHSHFLLRAGYEIEDWFDQFQVFDDASGGNSNDLVLQGLTVNMRVDF